MLTVSMGIQVRLALALVKITMEAFKLVAVAFSIIIMGKIMVMVMVIEKMLKEKVIASKLSLEEKKIVDMGRVRMYV